MIFIPYLFFFFIMIFLGSFISISRCNWIYVWVGLEINLLSFIPIISYGYNRIEVECSVKYFLVQAIGSCIILLGFFSYNIFNFYIINAYYIFYIIFISLILKIGIFPFHQWFPQIMGGLNWLTCFLLSVFQKLSPSMIICYIIDLFNNFFLCIVGCLGSLLGGLIGINQSQLRLLLSYSSIGHIGWILCSIYISFNAFFFYFLVYSFINLRIMILFDLYPFKLIRVSRLNIFPFNIIIFISFTFFSLGGLPPFLGFYPKFFVLLHLLYYNLYTYRFLLIISSLINLFYYISIFFNLLIISYFKFFVNLDFFNISNFFWLWAFFTFSNLGVGFFYLFL